jgi:hypothetical protein
LFIGDLLKLIITFKIIEEMTTYQKAKAAQTEKRLQEYESTVPHLPTLVSSQKAAANASRYTVVKFENPTAASPTAGSKDAASSLNSPKANEVLFSFLKHCIIK